MRPPGRINMQHIHIYGAPGSGVTTLGRELAQLLGYRHFDVDDYHWFTTDPEPYRRRRNPDHRRQLLTTDLDNTDKWVLSGSLCGWGDVFVPRFDGVIWCWLPVEIRLERIRQREFQRYGDRILPGGDLFSVYEKFIFWAAQYDAEDGQLRRKNVEKAWLTQFLCPTLVVEQPVFAPELQVWSTERKKYL